MKSKSLIIVILATLFLNSCGKTRQSNVTEVSSSVTKIKLSNDQITLEGAGLSGVRKLKIRAGKKEVDVSIISQVDGRLIGTVAQKITMVAAEIFSVVISTASGDSIINASFQLEGALSGLNVRDGQTVVWDSTAGKWVATDVISDSQKFIGSYNASNPSELQGASRNAGDYYIVSDSGNMSINGGSTQLFVVGDKLLWDGYKWIRIPGGNGSAVNRMTDLADVAKNNPVNGQSLVYDSAQKKWIPGVLTGAALKVTDVSVEDNSISTTKIRDLDTLINSTSQGREPTIVAPNDTGMYYRGDKSFARLNTDAVPEATNNKYYTYERVRGVVNPLLDSKVNKNDLSQSVTAGSLTASNITIPENSPIVAPSDVTNVKYVTDSIANISTDSIIEGIKKFYSDNLVLQYLTGRVTTTEPTGKILGMDSTGALVWTTGAQGPQGLKGDTGTIGAVGPQGPIGSTGPAGATGAQGLKGDTGTIGAVGPAGVQGPQGLKGDIGAAGAAGPQGPIGLTGPAGAKGTDGAQGPQGMKGDTGSQGPQGVQGEPGIMGLTGINGLDGKNAYDIALNNGFIGTQTQWLNSLVGATGSIGQQGVKGDTGATGSQGLKGDKGDTGAAGTAGAVGATGPQGPIGLTGPAGATGSQGIQGLKGDTGATGIQGPQGLKGDPGADGAVGATGPQGIQGLKGDKGDAGIAGPAGSIGAIGPQGPAGQNGTPQDVLGTKLGINLLTTDNSLISIADDVLGAFGKLQAQLKALALTVQNAIAGGVTSVNSKSGVVTLSTADVPENTNLYFTNSRSISVPLLGLNPALTGAISSSDSVLTALGKTQNQLDSRILKSSVPACTAGQVLKYDGIVFSCVTDSTGIATETDPTVKTFAKSSLPVCTAGQVLKSDGTIFSCVSDLGITAETDPLVKQFAKDNLPVCSSGQVLSVVAGALTCVTDNTGASAYTGGNNFVVVTNGSGALSDSLISTSKLNFLSSVTSDIQNQINGKQVSNIPNGTISIGQVAGASLAVTMSGDATITNAGVLALKNVGTANTYYSVTTDAQGRVVSGTTAAPVGGVSSVNTKTGAVTLTTTDVTEGTNLYHTDARTLATPITAPVLTNSAIAALDTVQVSLGKLQGQINSNSITSGGTNLQYIKGDKTLATLNTAAVPELTNLYFTNARVLGVPLVGFVTTDSTAITAADTVLQAIGKAQAQINNSTSSSVNWAIAGVQTIDPSRNVLVAPVLTNSVIALNDTYQVALGKLQAQTNSKQSATLADSKILVGNASSVATPVSVSGDATLSNAGVLSLTNTSVTAGTYTSVTVDSKGRVTAGTSPVASGVASVAVTAPLTNTGTATAPILGMPAATSAVDGYLKATDFVTFNNKMSSSLADSKILVGNATSVATAVALTGDATINNAGVLALKSIGTAGTYYSVTTDAQGRVVSGTTAAPVGGVSSVNTKTGAVTLTTTDVTEGTNLYFTNSRVLGAPLSGLVTTDTTPIAANDTVLQAIGKAQAQVSNKEGKLTYPTTNADKMFYSGDKTFKQVNSDVVVEGTLNKFFTEVKVLATVIGNLNSSVTGSVLGTDSLFTAISKIEKRVLAIIDWKSPGPDMIYPSRIYSGPRTVGSHLTIGADGYLVETDTIKTQNDIIIGEIPDLFTGMRIGMGAQGGNTVLGVAALNATGDGANNVAIGNYAITNSTPTVEDSVAIGLSSLTNLTDGVKNTAIGTFAGSSIATGSSNTFIGSGSGSNILSGENNLILGSYGGEVAMNNTVALSVGSVVKAKLDEHENVLLGSNAGKSFSTGLNNIFIGKDAGKNLTETAGQGNNNIIIGGSPGVSGNKIGNGNVIIGTFATFPGAPSAAIGNDTIYLGDGAGHLRMTIDGSGNTKFQGTTLASQSLTFSDERLKKDIKVVDNALERLTSLEGVVYNWRTDKFPEMNLGNKPQMGVIAQKVEKVFPQAVITGDNGIKTVAYNMLIAPIIEAIKELKKMVFSHSEEIAKLKTENKQMKDYICSTASKKPSFCK